MKVLVLSNGILKEREINNTLEELQEIVGGYIEIPYLSDVFAENEIDVIINEEGKFIDGLKPEIAVVYEETGRVLDVVYGNCIFASHDDEGNTTALTEEQKKVFYDKYCWSDYYALEKFDWFNKNHFDYRGLIPKGLAKDATNLNIFSYERLHKTC
jgi:hypothetical protein